MEFTSLGGPEVLGGFGQANFLKASALEYSFADTEIIY